jgi:hypothetical protein
VLRNFTGENADWLRVFVISQHIGQLRGRLEGFCAFHLKLRDFFALLLLKPKSDRISLRGGMVNPQSAKGWTWPLLINWL